jgi:hypothetical protein
LFRRAILFSKLGKQLYPFDSHEEFWFFMKLSTAVSKNLTLFRTHIGTEPYYFMSAIYERGFCVN